MIPPPLSSFIAAGGGGVRDSGALAGLSQLSILTLFIGSEWQTEHLWSDGGALTPFARRWRTGVVNSRTRQGSKEEQGQMYHRTRSRGRWRLRLRTKYISSSQTSLLHIKIRIFYRMLTKQRNILLKPQVV